MLLWTSVQVVAEKKFTSNPHSTSSAVLQHHRLAENGGVLGSAETESIKSNCSTTSSLDSSYSTSGPMRIQEPSSCSEFGTDNGAIIRSAVLGETQDKLEPNLPGTVFLTVFATSLAHFVRLVISVMYLECTSL